MKKNACATGRDFIGYGLGDFGMQASFGLVSSVLQKYYTDVLLIPTYLIMLLFIVARIWDAANDPMWGAFVDARPERKGDRYRRFMRYFSVPMGVCTLLMFVKIPGFDARSHFVFACITYILFGMVYTCVNVPYGSLAAVISPLDEDRSRLSVYRSVGSALGAVPSLLLISLCYVNTSDGKVMSYSRIVIGVAAISVLAAVCCLFSQRMVKERIEKPAAARYSGKELFTVIRKIALTRPFLSLSVAAMLFLAANVFSQSYCTYLADRYFHMPALSITVMVCQYLPVAIVMPFIGKLNRRFGRKNLCSLGALFAGLCYLALYFMQTRNPWLFIGFCFLCGIGNAFLFLQIWALVTEVVDYNHEKHRIYDDAMTYSLFSFIRKLGHAVAAIFVNASLIQIGYSVTNATEETLSGMYNDSVLIPAVLFLLVFLILFFIYPLGNKPNGVPRS